MTFEKKDQICLSFFLFFYLFFIEIKHGFIVLLKADKFRNINDVGVEINVFVDNASARFNSRCLYYSENNNNLGKGVDLIKVERKFLERLPEPHNHCVKQDTAKYVSDLFQYFVQMNKTYRQKDCIVFLKV